MSRWVDWHRGYDDPSSPLVRRLAIVQRAIGNALDGAAPGPIRYSQQDPALIARELLDAATALAALLDGLGATGWQRTADYQYPETRVRTVSWIGTHTVHEIQHHHGDIAAGS